MRNTALFPGSFDPFTSGHFNILNRALTMFDEVIIAVGVNQAKTGFFSNDKRVEIINQYIKGMDNVKVLTYDCLTIDLCRQMGITHIIRGVRNFFDYENERVIADANRRLAPEIETVMLPTAQEYSHISSTAVRDILQHGGDTSLFIPDGIKL